VRRPGSARWIRLHMQVPRAGPGSQSSLARAVHADLLRAVRRLGAWSAHRNKSFGVLIQPCRNHRLVAPRPGEPIGEPTATNGPGRARTTTQLTGPPSSTIADAGEPLRLPRTSPATVRDEEVVGSNPATPTQVRGPFPSGTGPLFMDVQQRSTAVGWTLHEGGGR
jgi:hypothetical protein